MALVSETPILSTERLDFFPFTPDDLPLLVELHSDPEVQRYIGGMWEDGACERRLDQYIAQQAEFGVSKWKAYLRDGTFVGRAGVSWWEPHQAFEIGYSFARAAWGRGLATEAASAIVDWFFATTPHRLLVGFTDVENLASRRVLEKVGMRWQSDQDLGFGGMSSLYRLERPNL